MLMHCPHPLPKAVFTGKRVLRDLIGSAKATCAGGSLHNLTCQTLKSHGLCEWPWRESSFRGEEGRRGGSFVSGALVAQRVDSALKASC